MVHDLIGSGADLNQSDGNGNTPLGLAAMHGHLEVVHTLTGAGADVNQVRGPRVQLYPMWTLSTSTLRQRP